MSIYYTAKQAKEAADLYNKSELTRCLNEIQEASKFGAYETTIYDTISTNTQNDLIAMGFIVELYSLGYSSPSNYLKISWHNPTN